MARILLENVCLDYPVYTSSRQRSLLGFAANRASFGKVARDAGRIPVVRALDNVSLDLQDGDRLAIIGRNGSGKTTMLKLLSGLLLPDSGTLRIQGTRSSIIHLGAGIDPERSGEENALTIAALLGVPRKRQKDLLEDLAEFTELGDFLNLPMRTYSAGMGLRLMFGLATSQIIPRDILIVDEVIGAGDALFIEKAARRVRGLFETAKILVVATHSGGVAAQLCTSCMWLGQGAVIATGDPKVVWELYNTHAPPESLAQAAE